jgi:hypothetical protein
VLILDVTEAEADKILATLDPLAAMADSDAVKLDELLRGVDTGSEALQQMMAATAAQAGLYETLVGQDEESESSDADESSENPYTDKVEVPPYAKIGDKPDLSQCFDEAYCIKLLKAIDASNLPENEKHFLRAAAYRHVVFNFQEIANYYAHSEADVQQLMEDSALVIVDLDAAIKNGWTALGTSLDNLFAKDEPTYAE